MNMNMNINEIFHKKEYIIIIIIILFYFKEDINTILIIFIFLIIFFNYHHNYFMNRDHKKEIKKDKKKNKINYNDNIEYHLNKLKKYKKYNLNSYNEGLFYWKQFIKVLRKLQDNEIHLYNQYFENAEIYFKQSINIFQSIGTSIYERSYIEGINKNNFIGIKNTKKIDKIVRKLYNEGYLLLYHLSLRLNKKWRKNPNINNKEIILEIIPYDKEFINDKLKFYI